MAAPRVLIIGAGVSGAACAAALHDAVVDVEVVDRGRAPGGQMASPQLHGRRVDLGAAYLTVRDPAFRAVVDDRVARGVLRAWTDTFDVLGDDGRGSAGGTQRYAAPGGLRALVRDLLVVDVSTASDVTSLDGDTHDAVVLAMPDPQAARVLGRPVPGAVDFEPVIAVAAAWPRRCWDVADAAFVNDDPDLTLIADDGSRRGDGAPVLVAHTTHDLARAHLDDPDSVVPAVLAALARLVGTDGEPDWARAHRWSYAKPAATHGDEPFGLLEHDARVIGLCNDSWCPDGAPRVESAWLSGTRLGHALAERLG